MGATYRQESVWREEARGEVRRLFVLSDTYEGLFAKAEDSVEANIFYLNDVTKGIKSKVGGLVEHELSLEIDELRCHSAEELAALAFVKQARTPSARRFVALFIDTSDPPSTDDLLFNGIIQPEFEGEDLRWFNGHYTSSPSPLRYWRIKAKPFSAGAIKNFSLEDLIKGNSSADIPGIPESFETANVADRQGYFLWAARNNRAVKVYNLVSLNKVLRQLADNLTAALANNDFGTINFSFERSKLDGSWHPARWVQSKIRPTPGATIRYPRYTFFVSKWVSYHPDPMHPGYIGSERGNIDHYSYLDDRNILYLDPDGSPTEFETAWVQFNLFKDSIKDDPSKQNAEGYRAYKKAKDLFELFDLIAFNFGCFLFIDFIDTSNIKIRFVPRNEFVQGRIYTKSAIKGTQKITSQQDTAKEIEGKSNPVTDEGRKYLKRIIRNSEDSESPGAGCVYRAIQDENLMSDKLFLTLSPTSVEVNGPESSQAIEDDDFGVVLARYPYNSYFAVNGVEEVNKQYGRAPGIHTAIYMKVSNYAEHINSDRADAERTPTNWWTPAACLTVKINGKDHRFYALSDYLKKIYEIDRDFFQIEYNLDVPFYYGFSENSDGSAPDWRVLDVGKVIALDGVTYTIVNIKWDLKQPLISLTLHAAARFDYDPNTTTALPEAEGREAEIYEQNKDVEFGRGGEGAAIVYGQVVCQYDEGLFTQAEPHISQWQKFYGIALGSAGNGDMFPILRRGEYEIPEHWSDIIPGQMFFLRKPNEVGDNVSSSPLTSKTDDENLYVYVGKATSARSIEIFENFPKQFKLEHTSGGS